MKRQQRIVLLCIVVVLALVALTFLVKPEWTQKPELELAAKEGRTMSLPTTPVTLGEQVVTSWVATSTDVQEQGLSGVTTLTDVQGMLFVFEEAMLQSFWNGGMLIPFDLVWIREGRVVGVAAKVPPYAEGEQILDAPELVTHVLELASGWTERHGLKVGNSVSL